MSCLLACGMEKVLAGIPHWECLVYLDSSLQFVLDTMGTGDSAEPDIRGGEGGGVLQ